MTRSMLAGATAGAAAWMAMDATLRFIYNRHRPGVRRSERHARDGVPALEVLAERVSTGIGLSLTSRQRQASGTALQWAMGISGGITYAGLRHWLLGRGLSRGLLYGASFSLVVDEGLTPLLGLAPSPTRFPWQTHVRGFIGHLVYGAAVEATIRLLHDGFWESRAVWLVACRGIRRRRTGTHRSSVRRGTPPVQARR